MARCYHGDCPCPNWAAAACCTSQVLIQFLYYPSLKMHFQRSTTVATTFDIHREMLPKTSYLTRPDLSTSFCSISSLFFTNNAYLFTSSASPSESPNGIANFILRDVLSDPPEYKREIGTKSPCCLQSHPWPALRAAPSDAESAYRSSNDSIFSSMVSITKR